MLKVVRIVYIVLFCAVMVFGTASRLVLDRKYPEPEYVKYKTGETFSVDGCDITVENANIMSYPDMCENILPDFTHYHNNADEHNLSIIFLDIKIKNVGESECVIPPVLYATFSSGLYSTASDMTILRELYNDDLSVLTQTLEPNEEVNVTMPYSVSGKNAGYMTGLIPAEKCNIVFSLYPKTVSVVLGN